tara:strand:- start:1166 stop:2434 length:1269 start_codon:yes stop_codon:yes gene_type:complete
MKICVIGLGYVGLPLLFSLTKKFNVTGFDISKKKIDQLRNNADYTGEVSNKKLKKINFNVTNKKSELRNFDVYIVCVPTPVLKNKNPNLNFIKQSSKIVGNAIKGSKLKPVIVLESTVYPGCSEEICIPIIEKYSNLKLNKEFYFGYSPERINPGISKHKLNNTTKIISSSEKTSLKKLKKIYGSITKKIYVAQNIKTAEAAKVIENIQRDLNIALMNELSIIFNRIDINTKDVLEAAATKWNFSYYEPGLVGGHCIGIDPYYMSYLTKKIGLKKNNMILAGRKTNEYMNSFIINNLFRLIRLKGMKLKKSKILILGYTFKENCNDVRNSKILEIFKQLKNKVDKVDLFDPIARNNEELIYFKKNILRKLDYKKKYNAVILAVKHDYFKKMNVKKILSLCDNNKLFFDLKGVFDKSYSVFRL